MRTGILLLLCLALAACYTRQHTHWDPASRDVGQLRIGDTVRVTTKKQKVYTFRVVAIDGDAFEGIGTDHKRYRIRREVIASMDVKRTHETQEIWLPFPFPAPVTGGRSGF